MKTIRTRSVKGIPARPSPPHAIRSGKSRIPQLWRVSALARRLGVSRQWVYRWIEERRIPSYRLFGAVLLKEEDIKVLLEQHQIPLERDRH
jgi:excisionase family DNA binding protein